LLHQFEILDQHLDRKLYTTQALDEFNPPDIEIAVISDAAIRSIHGRKQSNPLIVAERIC